MSKRLSHLSSLADFARRYSTAFVRWLVGAFFSQILYRDPTALPAWKAWRANLPESTWPWVDRRWAADRPRFALCVPMRPRGTRRTDVVYTGTLKPDAYKDLFALRKEYPHLHITVVVLTSLNPVFSILFKSFIFTLADAIVFLPTQASFVDFLLSTEAKVLVFQGGDDQFSLLNACIWPGRLVWQVRDTNLRAEPTCIQGIILDRAKYIAERADAIITFHSFKAWNHMQRVHDLRFRSAPVSIPPLCVPELGPHSRKPKLSARDGELHLVYAGGVGPRGGAPSGTVVHTHADFYEKFRSIADQGMHMHVYSPHLAAPTKRYRDYFALQTASRFFHIEQPLSFGDLLVEFTKYDWAIMHVTWQLEFFLPGFAPIQNGLMGPIQSRIPIIVSPTALGNADLVKRTSRGLVVSENQFSKLRALLMENAWLIDYCRTEPLQEELLYDTKQFSSTVLGQT